MKSFFNTFASSNTHVASESSTRVSDWCFAALLAVTALGCGARVEPPDPANSQTHWLESCVSNDECGSLECLCGVCTTRCTSETQCADLSAEAVCATGGDRCAALTSNPVCVKSCTSDDECPDDGTCTNGSCTVAKTGNDAGTPSTLPAVPNGELCVENAQCASGMCRSETCFSADARCVEAEPSCLDNIAQFCGCDGVTFEGSSGGYGCAPAPYAYVGGCRNGTQAAGQRCDVNEDCVSGVCEGQGCGAFEGVCAEENPRCTRDSRAYCGCDGTTFTSSGSCPGQRFASVGVCDPSPTEADCAGLPETACASLCVPVYGTEPDGSSRFLTCSRSGYDSSESFVCAQSPDGDTLSVPPTFVPEGWSATTDAACNPDCFSPFDDLPWTNTETLPGCECTSVGAACFDGIGLRCSDPTDDLDPTRHWSLAPDACEVDMDGCPTYSLHQCLDRYERCAQAGIHVESGDVIYCGASPIPCGERDEAGCDGECTSQWGITNSGALAYAGCLGPEELCAAEDTTQAYCIQRVTPESRVAIGEPVNMNTCAVPSGWTQLPLEYCEGAEVETTCLGRSQAQCTGSCGVRMGRRSPEGDGEFMGCADGECINSVTVCATNAKFEVVEFFGCLSAGWVEIDPMYCQEE